MRVEMRTVGWVEQRKLTGSPVDLDCIHELEARPYVDRVCGRV
jgi:hypothetical protein